MRVSVLSGSLPMRQSSANTTTTTTTSFRDRDNGLASSASSARSAVRRSSDSYASAMSGNTLRRSNGGMSPARMIVNETRASDGGSSGRTMELKDRPDSKFTPSNSSLVGSRRTHSPSSCCSLLFSRRRGLAIVNSKQSTYQESVDLSCFASWCCYSSGTGCGSEEIGAYGC